jgi:hypothetical protein
VKRVVVTKSANAATIEKFKMLMEASVMAASSIWRTANPEGNLLAFIDRIQAELQAAALGDPVRDSTANMVAEAMKLSGATVMVLDVPEVKSLPH